MSTPGIIHNLRELAPQGDVILVGGTFDPIHRAHVELPVAARADLHARGGAERGEPWLVWVPAALNPLKVGQAHGASAPDRLEMTRLATRDVGRGAVWSIELDRAAADEARGGASASYWVDTMRAARAELPAGTLLRFVIGADQAVQFHRWRAAREILELGEAIVLPRGAIADGAGLRQLMVAAGGGFWSDQDLDAWMGRVAPVGMVDLSATEVRAWLRGSGPGGAGGRKVGREGASEDGGGLDPRVAAYIRDHGLYR